MPKPRSPRSRVGTGPAGSGMAAIVTLFETVPQGGHVVAPSVMYHGTRDWLKRLEGKGRVRVTFFDPADEHALAAAMTPQTDIVRDAGQPDLGHHRYRGRG